MSALSEVTIPVNCPDYAEPQSPDMATENNASLPEHYQVSLNVEMFPDKSNPCYFDLRDYYCQQMFRRLEYGGHHKHQHDEMQSGKSRYATRNYSNY